MDASVINLFPAIRGTYREHCRNCQPQQSQVGFETPPPAYTPNTQPDLPHAFSVPLRIKFVQAHHFSVNGGNKMVRKVDDQIVVSENMRYMDVLNALRQKMAALNVRDRGGYFGAKTRGGFMGMGGRSESITEQNWIDVVGTLRSGYFESLELICK